MKKNRKHRPAGFPQTDTGRRELPEAFTARMRGMLGEEEYAAFAAALEKPRRQALRVNTVKKGWERFEEAPPFALEPVPWAAHGFYFREEDRPGKSPLHEAGVFYIQEPSAMAVGALSGVRPGMRVLDLCAAPGGKSTHLASLMQGEGLLISNEIHPARARILAQNIERMGIRNAVVMNETPERLGDRFPGFFDMVVVDAPCSGEGMFRKEEQAIPNWSPENVELCAARQDGILEEAAQMTAAGGTILYSTCTFAPLEDEGTVGRFLEKHPEFHAANLPVLLGEEKMEACGFAPGYDGMSLRLWPHRLDGEGHFAAVLRKEGVMPSQHSASAKMTEQNPEEALRVLLRDGGKWGQWKEFEENALRKGLFEGETGMRGVPVLFGEALFFLPVKLELRGLKVLRAGLHLGDFKKNRFEPSHALALALGEEDAASVCALKAEEEAEAFLRGASLMASGENVRDGWTLVTIGSFSAGWGKASGAVIKNHYPKGLRKG